MTLCLLLYETAQTAFFVPHGALSIELSQDYHERTRLYGLSHMIGIFGVAAGLLSLHFMQQAEDKRLFAFQLSLFAAASHCATGDLDHLPAAGARGSPGPGV